MSTYQVLKVGIWFRGI